MRVLKFLFILICLAPIQDELQAQAFTVGDTICPDGNYVNIPDTVIPFIWRDDSFFDIDIDNDLIKDIRFNRNHSNSSAFDSQDFTVISLDSVQFVCVGGTSDADTLSVGDTINENQYWNNNFGGATLWYYFSTWIPGQSWERGVCKDNNIYIGFRKAMPDGDLYGWFFFDLYPSFIIKSYAISKKLNVGINELGSDIGQIDIYPNPLDRFLDIYNMSGTTENFRLIILDLNGREVFAKDILIDKKNSIDLADLIDGVYITILQNEDQRIVNKFILHRP